MKVLSNITAASVIESPNAAPKGVRMMQPHVGAPGHIITHVFTDRGLFVQTGDSQVVIPLEELESLAATADPAFKPADHSKPMGIIPPFK
jgi:hypothetical protein